jgi:hypothetical protein
VYSNNSSNLEETRRTVKTTKAIRIIPIILIPEIPNQLSSISHGEAAVPTISSNVAFKGSLRKLKGNPAMHSLRQRNPQNLPLYQIYMATCGKSKHELTAVQSASLSRRAYLEISSYHTNQHSPPPWPGDDVCKEGPKGKSLGSVY